MGLGFSFARAAIEISVTVPVSVVEREGFEAIGKLNDVGHEVMRGKRAEESSRGSIGNGKREGKLPKKA